MVTMCGWRTLPASEASFWNCCLYTAPNSGSRNTSGSMVLSATSRPVNVSFARYTVPVAPLPSAFCTSYLPICRPSSNAGAAGAFSGIDEGGLGRRNHRILSLFARGPITRGEAHMKSTKLLLLGSLLALPCTTFAQQATVTERTLTLDAAWQAAAAALETCRKNGHNVTVTVLNKA